MVRAVTAVALVFALWACASGGVAQAAPVPGSAAVGAGGAAAVVRKPEEDLTMADDMDLDGGFEEDEEDDEFEDVVRMGRGVPEEDLTLTDDMDLDGGIDEDEEEDEFEDVVRKAKVAAAQLGGGRAM